MSNKHAGKYRSTVTAKPTKHVPIVKSDTVDTEIDMLVVLDPAISGTVVVQLKNDADGERQTYTIDIDHPIVADIKRVWLTGSTVVDANLMGYIF